MNLGCFGQVLFGEKTSQTSHIDIKESVNDINFSQDFNYLSLEEISVKGKTFYHLDMGEDFVQAAKIGQAELPIYTSMVEIPFCDGVEIEEHVLKYDIYKLKDNILIAPKQKSQSKQNEDIGYSFNKEYYNRNNFGQKERVSLEILGVMGGNRVGKLSISPIRYNPSKNTIEVARKIQVTIHFINSDLSRTIALREKVRNSFASFVDGKSMNKNISATVCSSNVTHPFKMVIVSDPMFQVALQPFIRLKIQQGFKIIEAYTDQPKVGNDTTSIRNYLKSLYDNATANDPAPDYLLLCGDVQQIPAFKGYFANIGETHYTDFYYAEYTSDMLPDIFYGRMSASTVEQMNNIINKTITYEKYQMSDPSYLDKALLIAGKEINEPAPTVGNGQVNYAKQYLSSLDTSVFYNPTCGTVNNQTKIKQKINDGQGWINYTAHCDKNGWYIPSYLISDVENMTNYNKYGIVINNCCLAGKYDEDECFTEALLRAENKGAVGVIGGSNYTYWYEDYYWSVGSKSPISNPVYDTNNLGMYDRLFHTHGEKRSNQYFTLGKMLQAGNLAVQAMNSEYTNYYWEIYNVEGDPSLIPYIGQGLTFPNQVPSIITLGTDTMNFVTVPYTYVAVSKNDTLIDAKESDSLGRISLNISSIYSTGMVNVIFTHQFYKPLIDSFNMINPSSPFIILNNIEFVKTSTNEIVDTLEENTTYSMNIKLSNLGTDSLIFNGKALMLDNDNDIQINNDSVILLSTLKANSSIQLNNCFSFTTNKGVVNNTKIPFNINILGMRGYSRHQIVYKYVNAPDLDITDFSFDVSTDTIAIGLKLTNKGTRATSTPSKISISNVNYVARLLADSAQSVNILEPNDSEQKTFHLLKLNNYYNSASLSLRVTYTAGNYTITKNLNDLVINGDKEDFESGNFSKHAWINGDNAWVIDNTDAHSGNFCARSKIGLADNSTSDLSITVNCLSDDTIRFFTKISSEKYYDFLYFYIDGVKTLTISGDRKWTINSFPIKAGLHTFLWQYSKDYANYYGLDAAWIDDIKLPLNGKIIDLHSVNTNEISIYPNPASNYIIVKNLKDNSNIFMFDMLGKMIYNKKVNTRNFNINLKSIKIGAYYIVIKDNKGVTYTTQKLIINK